MPVKPRKTPKEASVPKPRGMVARLRNYLLTGVLVTAPFAITVYLAWLFIVVVDARVMNVVPAKYHLPFGIPGLGLVVVIIGLIFIGWLTPMFLGRQLIRVGERILHRMPVVRSIYGATKQIFETVMQGQKNAFREVVLFEYPRRGSWALGFITGTTEGEVQNLTEDDTVNVFLPTTPNPTSGYLLFIPKRELVILSMSVEEGIKMIVSGGIVTPPDRRKPAVKKVKRVAKADGDKKTVLPAKKATSKKTLPAPKASATRKNQAGKSAASKSPSRSRTRKTG